MTDEEVVERYLNDLVVVNYTEIWHKNTRFLYLSRSDLPGTALGAEMWTRLVTGLKRMSLTELENG